MAIKLNVFQFIKYNFLSKNVHRAKGAFIIPFRPGKICLDKDSVIYLNGMLFLNKPARDCVFPSGNLHISGNSKLTVNGNVTLKSGFNIAIFNGGQLKFEGSNTLVGTSRICCFNSISIGEGSGMSFYSLIRDSTGHPSGTNPDNIAASSAPVVIGKHVWIGENASILQGTVIGDGAIIGNRAIVKGNVSPRTMVGPTIDKEILSGVYWFWSEETKNAEFRKFYGNLKPCAENGITSAPKKIYDKVCSVFSAHGYDDSIFKGEDLIGSKVIDSLSLLSLIAELEEQFSVKIPIREVNGQNFYSVGTIAALMDKFTKNHQPSTVNRQPSTVNNSVQARKPLELHIEDTEKTVIQRIFENSVKTPDKVAIITENSETTYLELCKLIYSYSETYRRLGVKAGDNIVLQAIRDVRYIAAFYACHLLSAVPVPVENGIGKERVIEIAGKTNAQLIICNSMGFVEKYIDYEELDNQTTVVSEIPLFSLHFPELNEPAQILFTTGTTGNSRGVVHIQKTNALSAYLHAKEFRLKNNEVQLLLSPLNHTMGINNIHTLLMNGQTLVIGDPNDLSALADLFKNTTVTAVCTPPVLLRLLTKHKEEMGLSELNYVFIAGAPLSDTDLDLFLSMFADTRLISLYGATESLPVCSAILSDDKEVTLGYPIQYVDVKLKLSNGSFTQKPKTAGIICVKSPMNMIGYYNEPDMTQSVFDGDYLVLNDLAYFDEKGRLHFAGRADDVINIGGYKISPIETEAVAEESGLVQECILIKSFDKHNNEYLELLAVPKQPEFSSEALMNFIKDKVEAYRVPKKITVVDELKKTYNGKLDRKTYRS
ncbi:MAG: AMP-binding protein [Bacteroidales bacterium]|nr:AMP-binding protein [Bacteroidales bacterium]